MKQPLPYVLLAVGWWLFSLYLLLIKPAGTPSGIPFFDKIGHFVLFAVWAVLLAFAFEKTNRAMLRPTLALTFLWAVLSELGQGLLTTTRSAEAGDVIADMCGAVFALYLMRRLYVGSIRY